MHLAVVGTGLMGGSFALAARRQGLFRRFTGVDPDAARARRAVSLGLVDVTADSVPADADAVLLAGPSDSVAGWVVGLAGHRGILFDTGSVKGAVLAEVRQSVSDWPARFVPCHPLAGSERSGPDAADATLFRDAEVIMTPTAETDAGALRQVEGWWQAIGARVCTMSPDQHDRVLALTSHLPHLLAFSYLGLIEPEHLPHTAGGFRDFTRIGASDARVWAAIFRSNGAATLAALDRLEDQLGRVRALLRQADDAELETFLRDAARRRGTLWERSPDRELFGHSRSGDRSHREGDRSHQDGDS